MKWDVFISHAAEDKEAIARPLAKALGAHGLLVWFDEFTLTVGDSLRRSIDYGLGNSRFGVTILSPQFFAKDWPQKELDGLVSREVDGIKVILPVWHEVNRIDVRRYSPMLADRLAASSHDGLDRVVVELLRAIKRESTVSPKTTLNLGATQADYHDSGKQEAGSKTEVKAINSVEKMASAMVTMVEEATLDVIRRVSSGETRVIEELNRSRKKKGLAGSDFNIILDMVAKHCNDRIDSYTQMCDGLAAKLAESLPKGSIIRNVNNEQAEQPAVYETAFVICSYIDRITLPTFSHIHSDSELIMVDSQIVRVIDELKRCHVLTPATGRGQTKQGENSSYYSSIYNQLITDNRTEVTEDAGLQILKGVFGADSGKVQLITFAKEVSRTRRHVVVNEYACYWSGAVDFDEVIYDHFTRWHLTLDLTALGKSDSLISAFQINSLHPTIEYEI